MNKCYWISWEGCDVGSTVGDGTFASFKCLCSTLPKSAFISPNIDTKNLRSRVRHEKLIVAPQVIITYGS